MKMGYAFHWMPGKLPFMVTPKQGFAHLQVKDDIPYLVSDGKLRSNRHRPTIDDLKEHFSEVLAMVTNDEADQGGDDDNEVTPAAVGESAEAEGEHNDGAFDFGPPGGAGPVRPPPVAEEIPVDVGSVPHRHGDAEAHEEEVDEDDPDAGIEVDVYEGSSIKRKVGVLKKEGRQLHRSFAYTQVPKSFLRVMRQGKDETLQITNGSLQEGGKDVRGPSDVRLRDGIRRP